MQATPFSTPLSAILCPESLRGGPAEIALCESPRGLERAFQKRGPGLISADAFGSITEGLSVAMEALVRAIEVDLAEGL